MKVERPESKIQNTLILHKIKYNQYTTSTFRKVSSNTTKNTTYATDDTIISKTTTDEPWRQRWRKERGLESSELASEESRIETSTRHTYTPAN